jgi:hypothetical protein
MFGAAAFEYADAKGVSYMHTIAFVDDAMEDYLYSGGDNPDPECTLHDAVDSYFKRDAG